MIKVEENKLKKTMQIAPHIFLWGFLFSFPLIFAEDETVWRRIIARNWLPLLFSAIVFYTNYFLLVDRYLMKKKVGLFILFNIALIFSCLFLLDAIKELYFLRPSFDRRPFPSHRQITWSRQGFSFLLAVIISVAVRITTRWYEAENKREKMENEYLKSELTYLRYQLQPHFFFNTLNNIYALVAQAPSLAQKSIHQLSKLMRYLLYESGAAEVPLSKEITFIKNYVHLMQLRVSEQTDIQVHVAAGSQDQCIAPLLFVSLIENAFKHGIHAAGPCFIHINLQADAQQLVFTAENSNHPKRKEDKSGSGIGLENLKKRLQITYPDRHQLVIHSDDHKYVTQLTIHFHENTLSDRR